MDWLLYSLGGAAVLFMVLLIWGTIRLRRGHRLAAEEIRKVELAEVEPLAAECVEVFRTKLGVSLDPRDCDDAARKLDAALAGKRRLKDAFERDGFYWYCVKPVGAFLGELLRAHAEHEWTKQPGEAPAMVVRAAGGESTAYPFEKVLKQLSVGDAGDVIAYVMFARAITQGPSTEH